MTAGLGRAQPAQETESSFSGWQGAWEGLHAEGLWPVELVESGLEEAAMTWEDRKAQVRWSGPKRWLQKWRIRGQLSYFGAAIIEWQGYRGRERNQKSIPGFQHE